jgi:hypothetical protein
MSSGPIAFLSDVCVVVISVRGEEVARDHVSVSLVFFACDPRI